MAVSQACANRTWRRIAMSENVVGRLSPDEYRINRIQAEYLAAETGLPAEKLVDRPLLEVQRGLEFYIDPTLLFFRKVCGRVVKKDPATGTLYGVPNATVHVEDTDCSFLGFFPVESPLFWLWPVFCRREEIASTRTDRCGNFCVWVPRWDIDRVLRLRRERICLPDLVKPSIRDLIDRFRLEEQPIFPPRPGPGPDPAPFELDRGALRLAAHTIGQDAA